MTPEVHGDVKTFVVASFPSEWIAGVPADPSGTGAADGRLKLGLEGGPWRLDVHHDLTIATVAAASPLAGAATGVGLGAPELVALSWEADTGTLLSVRGRVDRLVLAFTPPHVSVALGRQPVSFGTGVIFTPMDVVNPFSPAVIDTEYKPGVDALRVDVFSGVSGRLTAVAAWVGDPDEVALEDVVLVADGQATIGVTDVQPLVGLVRGEVVGGVGVASSIGPVGVHGDATVTVPTEDDPFVRAVIGADGRPTGSTTVSLELAHQGSGGAAPEDYLRVAGSERFLRGESWQLGRWYAALAVSQEITPLVSASAALIANVADPSALVAPSLQWSVSDEATVGVGGYLGLGQRPDEVAVPTPAALGRSVRSEFGLYPHALFVQMKAYF